VIILIINFNIFSIFPLFFIYDIPGRPHDINQEIYPSDRYINGMEEKIWLTWDDNTLRWGDQDGFVWDQVYIVKKAQAALGVNIGGYKDPFDRLREEMKEDEVKKFIKVVCEVNGRIYSESKYQKIEKKITVDDIQRTFDRFVNVKIDDI